MNKMYWVNVPVDAHICVQVEASSEEEAKELALGAEFRIDLTLSEGQETIKGIEVPCFEPIKEVNKGNVCYLTQWEIEVEYEADLDE